MAGGALVLGLSVAGIVQHAITETTHRQHHPQIDQPGHDHSGHIQEQVFEPLVDGARSPELIPDEVAIRALMQTLRAFGNGDGPAPGRMQAGLARVNLSDADMEITVRMLREFDEEVRYRQQQMEFLRPSSEMPNNTEIARFVEAYEQFNSLMVDQYDALRVSLSPDGARQLHEHLNHVKSRIRIYPTPDMTGGSD